MVRRIALGALTLIVLALLSVISVATFITLGLHVSAHTSGTILERGVEAPVQIIRDARAGSKHYTDFAPDWVAGRLVPMAYSRATVAASARAILTLRP